MESIATVPRISREELSSLLLSADPSSIAVVDVRDDDHAGGHIHGSIHMPSSSVDSHTPEIVTALAQKQIVVFHCSLSQQRGPGAALRYLREKEAARKMKKTTTTTTTTTTTGGGEKRVDEGEEEEGGKSAPAVGVSGVSGGVKSGSEEFGGSRAQEVFVLDGGFVKWQEKYVFCFAILACCGSLVKTKKLVLFCISVIFQSRELTAPSGK